ncbi:MAG: hypothetical protein HY898_23620 [Deltaproteobacteria bacterium]|nr:hypothetical protein [Deltaproteobacteria bacterium]
MRFFSRAAPALPWILLALAGCGGNPEVVSPPAQTGGSGGATDASTDQADTSPGGTGGSGGTILTEGGTDADAADVDPCSDANCPVDQHCVVSDGGSTCIPNLCSELGCLPTQVCVATDAGAYCKDNSCTTDLQCGVPQYCNGTICVDDECVAGSTRCEGKSVMACLPNGSGEATKYTCGSGSSYFDSKCSAVGSLATCGCEDDWDCPAFTTCDVDGCVGTGQKPTCSLPPEPFQNMLPTNEISWGGTFADPNANGSPFPPSAQVVMAPLVANLDDDNGDGLVDERDFPEIIFTTFCNHDLSTNGVLRAIHGGGANKGKDFFASCGTTVWHEGTDPTTVTCACANADLDSTASLAVGDLDYDGLPEIVAITEGAGAADAEVRIYSNTGVLITTSTIYQVGGPNPAPTLANIDNAGFVEIVVGRIVLTLAKPQGGTLGILDRFEGSINYGKNNQGPVSCIANLVGDSRQEIVAGTTVYRYPKAPAGAQKRADCKGTETDADEIAWCAGQLPVVWDGQAKNGTTLVPNGRREGFCAVADILGADVVAAPGPNNPLDGKAEVIVISAGYLQIFNGETGDQLRNIQLAPSGGGTPNVDDFDGDGFPEVSSAFAAAFVVADLQDPTVNGVCDAWPLAPADDTAHVASVNKARTPPAQACTKDSDCGDLTRFACNESLGKCVCLHNGWKRTTEDDSSQVTGSSVFDFNGDGAAEVVYNDECRFRIYDGLTGDVWFREPSESRTRIEYPVVADVDNDGNAEIVFATTNESGFCSESLKSQYNNGIEVWGDASDLWVSARRIWNQHAYHVTNVTESGKIPVFEAESWKTLNGRRYNTYRSNPRNYDVAPDLKAGDVQVSSPDAACGQLSSKLDVIVQVRNIGDLRVGPGVVIGFYGEWTTPPLQEALHGPGAVALTATLQTSLEPGEAVLVTVHYDAVNNAPGVLPDQIRVVVDDGNTARECDEGNNERKIKVDPGVAMADLRIDLGAVSNATCPEPKVPTTVYNDGSAPASNVRVRYYAGDPSAGGTPLHEEVIPGPIAPGGNASVTATLTGFPKGLLVLIYGVVDPDNAIVECNDGNNSDTVADKIICNKIQ